MYNYTPLPEPIPITEQVWPEGTLPLVHTRTMTYNHVNYIRDCIEGILMQKTTFPVVVLIHDDASTDGTAEIVREYQEKYPNLIKAYFQTENSHSKGNPLKFEMRRAFFSLSIGKYEAICEGDDYWTDPYKLQMQVEHMESNPQMSLCVHASKVVKSSTGKVVRTIRPSDFSRYFDTEEIIEGGGGLFATNSMLFKRASYVDVPSYFTKSTVGDYPLMIHLSTTGKVYYLDTYLSVYRTALHGSWTSRTHSGTIQKMLDQKENSVQLLQEIDQFYERRYARAIQRKIREIEFDILLLMGDIRRLGSSEFADIYASLGYAKKILILLTRSYYPKVYANLKRTASSYNKVIEFIFIHLNYLKGTKRNQF